MASSKWKTYEELKEVAKNKKIIFWGASDWIGKTIDKINLPIECIIDKSKLNQGVVYNGFKIFAPEILKGRNKDNIYVVITTGGYYMSVIEELQKMGFIMGDHFCCSPELNKRKDKDDLLSHKATILLASPKHTFDDKTGGGLYKYTICPEKRKKVYSGKCRGVAKGGGKYYVIDMLRGIVILDKNFNEEAVIDIQKNSEPHGLAVDEESSVLYIATPGRDSVAAYSLKTRKLVNEFFLSNKWKYNKKDNHHINDLYIRENSIFASIFSFTGNWPNEVYDGGVVEIEKNSGKIVGSVITGQWMPHSVIRVNSEFVFLNSMLGELRSGAHNKLAAFSGFTRGLGFDGKYYFIGSSIHRYPEKLAGISNNIGLDCGFYMYDPKTKMSKFFKMDEVESIHSLIVL